MFLRRSYCSAILCAVAMLVAVMPAAAEEPVLLRYKLKEGDTAVYRTTTSVEQSQKVGEMDIKSTIAGREVSVATVQQATDEKITLQVEHKQISANLKLGGVVDYEFDSKAANNDRSSQLGALLTPLYEAMSTAFITVEISPRGEVLNVKGFKDLIDANVLKDNPFSAIVSQQASDEGAKLSYSDRFVQLPEQPIQAGDTWEVPIERELPGIGKLTGKYVYKYEGPDKLGEQPTAKITGRYDLAITVDTKQGEAKVTGSLSITEGSGTIHFDPEAGRLVSNRSEIKLAGNLTVQVGDMTIPIQQEQTQSVHIELLDKLPE
ncbi:MAG: hypothetical protein KY476_25630 [Planctomycetes bacterium]|nr:hypothetical protein [Planctomycetota bacterium]